MHFYQHLLTMFLAKTEAIKKLSPVVVKNTSQQSPYKQGIELIGQPKHIFWDSVVICLFQSRRAICY